jgi:hypothetical protein
MKKPGKASKPKPREAQNIKQQLEWIFNYTDELLDRKQHFDLSLLVLARTLIMASNEETPDKLNELIDKISEAVGEETWDKHDAIFHHLYPRLIELVGEEKFLGLNYELMLYLSASIKAHIIGDE